MKVLKGLSLGSLRFITDLLFHLAQGSYSHVQAVLKQVFFPWLHEDQDLAELEGRDLNIMSLLTCDATVIAMPKANIGGNYLHVDLHFLTSFPFCTIIQL